MRIRMVYTRHTTRLSQIDTIKSLVKKATLFRYEKTLQQISLRQSSHYKREKLALI